MPLRSQSHSPRQSYDRRIHRTSRSSRSRSPHRDDRHHRKHRDRTRELGPVQLPYNAQTLSRRHELQYRNLFAVYLDVQKQLSIEDLPEHEVRGRWKSFMNKWNRGELAEGWYDPVTFSKAEASNAATEQSSRSPQRSDRQCAPASRKPGRGQDSDNESDDDFGPSLPSQNYRNERRAGPNIPDRGELEYRDEQIAEDARNQVADLRYSRKQDRKEQKERMEELVPRAEPGSRERQLERKREAAASAKSFREGNEGGVEEVTEGDLLGDDGIDSYKAQKREVEKKKNEREIRKEELLRTRAAEREERLAEHRAKEDKTMEMLKAIAKQRFG